MLIVLTVRALANGVRIIASVAEPENVKIVRSGGADETVSPSHVGGYLMADAVGTQGTIDFVSELLSYRGKCQLVEREARAEEVGRLARETEGTLIVEIRRGQRRFGCWDDPTLRVEAGDRVIAIDAADSR